MAGSCGHGVQFEGVSGGYKRALIAVIAINAAMFVVELSAGSIAGSMALTADSLDFLADSLTYGVSLWVIGRPLAWRAWTALAKGVSLAAMGAWVFGATVYQVFVIGVPDAAMMSGIGMLALVANLVSVMILFRWRDGDSNVRSVWLCSRNDAIGNVAVVVAGGAVYLTGTGWPDVIVAGIMAALFLKSSVAILRQSTAELRYARTHADTLDISAAGD
ncbi:MAG: cation transporter [Alphaproteobacteria bacterium]|nr:cation transporter [Alphaproteobacteria bacterium]